MGDKYATVWKHKERMSSKDLSKPSKHLLFISCHKHQNRQVGSIFQTAALLDFPEDHQQASKSTTRLGITQANPKQLNMASHKVEAISQCKRRWSTVSSLLLHMQHLFITITCLFLRLSKVRILSSPTEYLLDQDKETYRDNFLLFSIL